MTARNIGTLAATLTIDTSAFAEQLAEADRQLASFADANSRTLADAIAAYDHPNLTSADLPTLATLAEFDTPAPDLTDAAAEFERLAPLARETDEAMQRMSKSLGAGLAEAITDGRKFESVLDSLGSQLAKLALSSALTGIFSPLFGGTPATGKTTSFGGFFADGGHPPVGLPSIVGERGPELFVPSSAGTIMPNHTLGGTTNVYQIDARGNGEETVKNLTSALFALAGPGVVERRALAAHASTLRRGGASARAVGA